MDEQDKALLLFQLGPVQKFIAQAETIGDLRAGSEMLSELTAAALKCVPDWDAQGEEAVMVFPAVKDEGDLKGIPNRFLAYVPRDKAETIAKAAVDAAKKKLVEVSEADWLGLCLPENLKDAYLDQVKQFLQTTWAVLKEPTGDMGNDYATIGKLLAMRRNLRAFDAWHEERTGVVKDFLSGKEVALDVQDGCSSNRNCGRGAMNLIKAMRTTVEFNKRAKDALGKYLAVIAMDGDHMGEKLSGFRTKEGHRIFSEKLAGFANWLNGSEQDVIPSDGHLIYAGGDDVLAVVKAADAVVVARRLAEAFYTRLNDADRPVGILSDKDRQEEKRVTASVGVAIGSTNVPLQDLVHAAHAAESRAKHGYGRDAFAMNIYKRSGEILEWGCKFGSAAFDVYDRLTKESGKLSRFAYKLASFIEPYALKKGDLDGTMHEVVKQETLHVLEQTTGVKDVLSAKTLEKYLGEPSVKERPEDYLGLFMCETFINRPRD